MLLGTVLSVVFLVCTRRSTAVTANNATASGVAASMSTVWPSRETTVQVIMPTATEGLSESARVTRILQSMSRHKLLTSSISARETSDSRMTFQSAISNVHIPWATNVFHGGSASQMDQSVTKSTMFASEIVTKISVSPINTLTKQYTPEIRPSQTSTKSAPSLITQPTKPMTSFSYEIKPSMSRSRALKSIGQTSIKMSSALVSKRHPPITQSVYQPSMSGLLFTAHRPSPSTSSTPTLSMKTALESSKSSLSAQLSIATPIMASKSILQTSHKPLTRTSSVRTEPSSNAYFVFSDSIADRSLVDSATASVQSLSQKFSLHQTPYVTAALTTDTSKLQPSPSVSVMDKFTRVVDGTATLMSHTVASRQKSSMPSAALSISRSSIVDVSRVTSRRSKSARSTMEVVKLTVTPSVPSLYTISSLGVKSYATSSLRYGDSGMLSGTHQASSAVTVEPSRTSPMSSDKVISIPSSIRPSVSSGFSVAPSKTPYTSSVGLVSVPSSIRPSMGSGISIAPSRTRPASSGTVVSMPSSIRPSISSGISIAPSRTRPASSGTVVSMPSSIRPSISSGISVAPSRTRPVSSGMVVSVPSSIKPSSSTVVSVVPSRSRQVSSGTVVKVPTSIRHSMSSASSVVPSRTYVLSSDMVVRVSPSIRPSISPAISVEPSRIHVISSDTVVRVSPSLKPSMSPGVSVVRSYSVSSATVVSVRPSKSSEVSALSSAYPSIKTVDMATSVTASLGTGVVITESETPSMSTHVIATSSQTPPFTTIVSLMTSTSRSIVSSSVTSSSTFVPMTSSTVATTTTPPTTTPPSTTPAEPVRVFDGEFVIIMDWDPVYLDTTALEFATLRDILQSTINNMFKDIDMYLGSGNYVFSQNVTNIKTKFHARFEEKSEVTAEGLARILNERVALGDFGDITIEKDSGKFTEKLETTTKSVTVGVVFVCFFSIDLPFIEELRNSSTVEYKRIYNYFKPRINNGYRGLSTFIKTDRYVFNEGSIEVKYDAIFSPRANVTAKQISDRFKLMVREGTFSDYSIVKDSVLVTAKDLSQTPTPTTPRITSEASTSPKTGTTTITSPTTMETKTSTSSVTTPTPKPVETPDVPLWAIIVLAIAGCLLVVFIILVIITIISLRKRKKYTLGEDDFHYSERQVEPYSKGQITFGNQAYNDTPKD